MKKKGGKFFACFFIILIFSGVVFFFGWTQFRIKPNQFGFVISKTCGIDKTPLEYGKFSWNWVFLIPKNAELLLFDLSPYYIQKKSSGTLTNSENYKKLFNEDLDFDFEISFDFKISVSKENITSLFENKVISNQSDLEKYIDSASQKVCDSLTSYFLTGKQKDFNFKPEMLSQKDFLAIAECEELFTNLDFSQISLISARLPDFEIYNKIRTEYISGISYFEPTVIYTDRIKPGSEKNVILEILKENAKNQKEIQNSN